MSSNRFWRPDEPLTEKENLLLEKLARAHDQSARRDNPSSLAVVQSFCASGDYTKAIASALMTLGAMHAPIEDTIRFLAAEDIATVTQQYLALKRPVPGWGNSFVKGGPDPIWGEVTLELIKSFPEMIKKFADVTKVLHEAGKIIFPNPSAYTAATAMIIKLPPHLAPFLFIYTRLPAWTELIYQTTHGNGS